jgi:hypothetical protein
MTIPSATPLIPMVRKTFEVRVLLTSLLLFSIPNPLKAEAV